MLVHDRVMTSHDACTSGTSIVLTVASLQRSKVEALISAPVDCEVWSGIKFLNAQRIASIESHRELCHVYGHIRLDNQHISCRISTGRCLIINRPVAGPHVQWFPSFLTPQEILVRSASAFSEWLRGGGECHGGSNPKRQTSTTQDTKVGPTLRQLSQLRRWICWKIAQHSLYLY